MLSGLKGRLNTVARTQGAKPAAPASAAEVTKAIIL